MTHRLISSLLIFALTTLISLTATGAGINVQIEEPRAFAHFVGDVVERRLTITTPRPLSLAVDSIPKPGRLGYAFELREANLTTQSRADGTRYELVLRYQIFVAPAEVKTLDLPSFVLQFDGAARPEELRIDFAPVSIAPLTSPGLSVRKGPGALRPDVIPPLIDARPVILRLAACAAVIGVLLVYLGYVYLGLPYLSRRQRPFTRAYSQLRRLRTPAADENFNLALKQIHAAFNDTAGGTVFKVGLDHFLAAHPRFAPLRSEIARFFDSSRQAFFAADSPAAKEDLSWLLDLCRNCRDIERGAA